MSFYFLLTNYSNLLDFFMPENEYQAERAVWERVGGRDFGQPEGLKVPLRAEEKVLIIIKEKLTHYLTLLGKGSRNTVASLMEEMQTIPRLEYYDLDSLSASFVFKSQHYSVNPENIRRISTTFDISDYNLYRYLRFYNTIGEFPE